MSDWPKCNPERHVDWMSHLGSTALLCNCCLMLCAERYPCRCCETARADEAEAALARVRTVRDKWHDHRSLEMFSAVCIVADLTDALDGGVSAISCAACGGSGFADYAAVPCPVCRGAE